jgi:hypothetical protein
MLHPAAVSVTLLQVLRDLQDKTAAAGFALAGGTSLALRLGHRVSVDLDFFTGSDFHPEKLAASLPAGHGSITGIADGTLQLVINGIKVEFLKHAYPQLADHDLIDDLRMWSLADVSAMKLNAIANRGSKKDFSDVVALLDLFPLPAMIAHYQVKYRPASLLMVIRSLAWFEDAEAEPDPVTLNGNTWPDIRETISRAIRTLE